ncbi:MAG TPA: hypothetical protein DCM28_00065, partial [Phycisphaerales bacterium]|nr:hypothetical protein [Phycisphaerales bacterium]
MIKRRWHYQCPYQLVANYGHVSYQGSWVIGSRFVLERETGKELWHRQFVRPNMLFDCTDQMLIETEWRSDSPFANGLWGIYGIDLINGRIRWVNHANGYRGKFLRLLDYIPAYTNGFRDSPKQLIGDVLVTHNNRYLDVHTGESTDKRPSISASGGKSESVIELSKCVLEEDTGQYLIAMNDSTWTFRRHDRFYDIRLENSD